MSHSSKDINEEFFSAIKSGDFKKVKDLKARGAQIDCPRLTDNNYTTLHVASEHNFVEIVDFLLSNNADPNCEADRNVTPLHLAAEKGHLKIIELLLGRGANMNTQTEKGSTPLLLAVEHGYTEVVSLLLKQGACVNTMDNENNSPLSLIVELEQCSLVESILEYKPDIDGKINKAILQSIKFGEDNHKIVSYMMGHGFTVDQEDVNDCKLLNAAVKKNYLKIVERLLENGADPNNESFDFPLLCHTVEHINLEMTQLLLKFGCDVNSEDKDGRTPISYSFTCIFYRYGAKPTQNERIFLLLKASGADVKKAVKYREMLRRAVEFDFYEVCKSLIESGADVNVGDSCGQTPLHIAVARHPDYVYHPTAEGTVSTETNKGKIIKLLLENGANPNLKVNFYLTDESSTRQFTPLHIAVLDGNTEAVCILLNFKTDVNARSEEGSTPLHLACENCNVEIVEMLLKNKADVGALQLDGLSPLQIAVNRNYPELVEILLKYDAEIDAVDAENKTALHTAIKKDYDEVVKVLLDNNSDINVENSSRQTALGLVISEEKSIRNRVNNRSNWYSRPSRYDMSRDKYDDPNNWRYDSDDDHFNTYIGPESDDEYDPYDDPYDRYGGDYDPSDDYNNIIKTLMMHAIKLNVAGLYVSDKNLQYLNANSPENVSRRDFLHDFRQDCEVEVSKMKEQQVCRNVTIYNILVNRNNPPYVRDKTLIQILESFDFTKFEIYKGLLLSSVENIKKISELITPAGQSLDILARTSNVFNEKRSPILPTETLEKVVSYLGKKDLKNLISCGKNLKKQVSK